MCRARAEQRDWKWQQLVEVDLDLGPLYTTDAVAKPKHSDLSLKLKYEVIKTVDKKPKVGIRKLAGLFSCGKTQNPTILKTKVKQVEMCESPHKMSPKIS